VSAAKTVAIDGSDVQVAQDWVAFTLGAATQACFSEQGSAGRNERSRWAARTLMTLFRVVVAAFAVARNHPEEFKSALGEPVEVEPMP
jgi:hypothetical protein